MKTLRERIREVTDSVSHPKMIAGMLPGEIKAWLMDQSIGRSAADKEAIVSLVLEIDRERSLEQ